MATVAFETLKPARALRDAQFTNGQTEGAADAIAESNVEIITWGVGIAIVQGGCIVGLLHLLH